MTHTFFRPNPDSTILTVDLEKSIEKGATIILVDNCHRDRKQAVEIARFIEHAPEMFYHCLHLYVEYGDDAAKGLIEKVIDQPIDVKEATRMLIALRPKINMV